MYLPLLCGSSLTALPPLVQESVAVNPPAVRILRHRRYVDGQPAGHIPIPENRAQRGGNIGVEGADRAGSAGRGHGIGRTRRTYRRTRWRPRPGTTSYPRAGCRSRARARHPPGRPVAPCGRPESGGCRPEACPGPRRRC